MICSTGSMEGRTCAGGVTQTISATGEIYSTNMVEAETVRHCEPIFWCMISYNEMRSRLGETFHASQIYTTIDGFTDPGTADRYVEFLLVVL